MLLDEGIKKIPESKRSWVARLNEDLYVLSNLSLALACLYSHCDATSGEDNYQWCLSLTNTCLVLSAVLLLLEVVPSYRHSCRTRRLLMGGNELLRGIAVGLLCCGLWKDATIVKNQVFYEPREFIAPTILSSNEKRLVSVNLLINWFHPTPVRLLEIDDRIQNDLNNELTYPYESSYPVPQSNLNLKPLPINQEDTGLDPSRIANRCYVNCGVTLLIISLCLEMIVAFNRQWVDALKDLCFWNGKSNFITRISGLAIRFWACLVSTVCLAMIVFTRAPDVVGKALNDELTSPGCSYVCQLNVAHGLLALFGLVVCLNPSLRGSTILHWLFFIGFATNVFAMLVSALALREIDVLSPALAAEKEVFLFQVLLLLCCAPVWAHHNALRRWKRRMQRVENEFEEMHWTQQHKMVPSVNTV